MLPIILCIILQNPSLVFGYIFVSSPWSAVHKRKIVMQMGKSLNMYLSDADCHVYCAVSVHYWAGSGVSERRNRGFCSSRMWLRFVGYVFPDVSKEPVSIFLNWKLSRITNPWWWRSHVRSKSQQTLTTLPPSPLTRRRIPEDLSPLFQLKYKYATGSSFFCHFNTFASSYLNTQGLNNSCLKSRQRRP